MFQSDLAFYIANIPALLIGFAFHEFAHAWAADRLGDPTPRSQGRLTLNPIAHLDLMGTLMALLFRFGWAKPVQTNPRYYKMDPMKGHTLVALAGPVMNLLVAFIMAFILEIINFTIGDSGWGASALYIVYAVVYMNLGLAVFNLLPIPPLDGFSVVTGLLPSKWAFKFRNIEPYGWVIMLILIFTGLTSLILFPVISGLFYLFDSCAYFVISFFV